MSANEAYKLLINTIGTKVSIFYLYNDVCYIFDEPINNIDDDVLPDSWIVYKKDGKIEKVTPEKIKELKSEYGKPKRGQIS